jgi:hypothetical protein
MFAVVRLVIPALDRLALKGQVAVGHVTKEHLIDAFQKRLPAFGIIRAGKISHA